VTTLRQIAVEIPLGFECRSCGGSAYNWITKIDRYIQTGEGCCPDFRGWVAKAENTDEPRGALSSNDRG
jgi:hypothetical protein